MTTPEFTIAQAIALAAESGAAPEWVQLFPAGPEIVARDGRRFRMSRPEAVVAAFEANDAPIPIDVEHASSERATKGLPAPAYGWVEALEVRDGAVWGRVEWTAQAKEWIEGRNYRFLSPGFLFDKQTLEISRLAHVGLVNTPAFKMAALAREGAQEETVMDPTVLEALGLPADGTPAQAVAAIGRLKDAEATAKAADPDPALFVPAAQLEAANAKLAEFEAAETAREQSAIEADVDAAVTAGKVAPAARDQFVATCKALGRGEFAKMVANMPVIAGKSGLDNGAPATGDGEKGLSEDELALCKAMGTDPAVFAKAKQEEAR